MSKDRLTFLYKIIVRLISDYHGDFKAHFYMTKIAMPGFEQNIDLVQKCARTTFTEQHNLLGKLAFNIYLSAISVVVVIYKKK